MSADTEQAEQVPAEPSHEPSRPATALDETLEQQDEPSATATDDDQQDDDAQGEDEDDQDLEDDNAEDIAGEFSGGHEDDAFDDAEAGAASDDQYDSRQGQRRGMFEDEDDYRTATRSMTLDLPSGRMLSAGSNQYSRQMTGRTANSGQSGSRPFSPLMEGLRGARPSSAAVAAHIDGFGDDFEDREEQLCEGTELETEDNQEVETTVDVLLERAREEHAALLIVNESLQRRLRQALDVRNKGRQHGARDLSRLDGAEARFRGSLGEWSNKQEELRRLEAMFQELVLNGRANYEARSARAQQVRSAYRQLVAEVAAAAEYTQSGRPLNPKVVAELQQQEQQLDNQVQLARLRALHSACNLRRLEKTSSNDQVAEGLHLIDFEQLKIENQSLNERIEEKNEQLLALRKKTTQTVLVLTHLKEKLQFVEREAKNLQDEKDDLEAQVNAKRAELQKQKQARDSLRTQAQRVREGSSTVSAPPLLQDMKHQADVRLELQYQVQQLQQQHAEVTARNAAMHAKVQEAMQELAASTGVTVEAVEQMIKTMKPGATGGAGKGVAGSAKGLAAVGNTSIKSVVGSSSLKRGGSAPLVLQLPQVKSAASNLLGMSLGGRGIGKR